MLKKFFTSRFNALRAFSYGEKWLVLIVVALIGWLCYYNVTTAYFHMDSDVVVDSILIPKIVSERGVFFNDWVFGHEAMFSRPFVLTLFLRLFISDWIMAVKVGITVTTSIIAALFYGFCRRANLSRASSLIGIIFLLATNMSVFNSFRGDNFYPTFVIIPLLTGILYMDLHKSKFSFRTRLPDPEPETDEEEDEGPIVLSESDAEAFAALDELFSPKTESVNASESEQSALSAISDTVFVSELEKAESAEYKDNAKPLFTDEELMAEDLDELFRDAYIADNAAKADIADNADNTEALNVAETPELSVVPPPPPKPRYKYNGKNITRLIALLFIALLSGFFGIRMTAVLYLPIAAVAFFTAARNIRGETGTSKTSLIQTAKSQVGFWVIAAMLVFDLIGYAALSIYERYAEGIIPAAMSIWGIAHIVESNFKQILPALWRSLCILPNGVSKMDPTFAEQVAEAGLRVFLILSVIFVFRYMMKSRKKFSARTMFATDYLVASFIGTFCIMMLIGQLSTKYFYFVWYPLAFGVACLTDRTIIRTALYRRFVAVVVAALCMIAFWVNDWAAVQSAKEKHAPDLLHHQIATFLKDNGYEAIYADFWDSSVTASYANMAFDAGHFAGDSFAPYVWAVDKQVYFDNDAGKYAIVVNEGKMNHWQAHESQYKRDFIERYVTEVTRFHHFVVYETPYNPAPVFRRPVFKGDTTLYEFHKKYAGKADGVRTSFEGRYVETGDTHPGQQILWTVNNPPTLLKGKYELVIDYEILEEGAYADFTLTSKLGAMILGSKRLDGEVGRHRATLSVDVSRTHTGPDGVEKKIDRLDHSEFKIHAGHGQVRLYCVEITKVR